MAAVMMPGPSPAPIDPQRHVDTSTGIGPESTPGLASAPSDALTTRYDISSGPGGTGQGSDGGSQTLGQRIASLDPHTQRLLEEVVAAVFLDCERTLQSTAATWQGRMQDLNSQLLRSEQRAEAAIQERDSLGAKATAQKAELASLNEQMQNLTANYTASQTRHAEQEAQVANLVQQLTASETAMDTMRQKAEETETATRSASLEAAAAYEKAVKDAEQQGYARGREESINSESTSLSQNTDLISALDLTYPVNTDKGSFYSFKCLEENPKLRLKLEGKELIPGILDMSNSDFAPSAHEFSSHQQSQAGSEEVISPGARALQQLHLWSEQPRNAASPSMNDSCLNGRRFDIPSYFGKPSFRGTEYAGHHNPYAPAYNSAGDLHTTAPHFSPSFHPGVASGHPIMYGPPPALFGHQVPVSTVHASSGWQVPSSAPTYPPGYASYVPSMPTLGVPPYISQNGSHFWTHGQRPYGW